MLRLALAGLAVCLVACAEPPNAAAAPAAKLLTDGATSSSSGSPFRVAVISDMNGSYGSTQYGDAVHGAVDRLLTLRPDIVLSTGDMVAGQRRGVNAGAMWESFHATVSDRLASASIPFAVTPGNHDGSGYPAWASERAVFVEEWRARVPNVQMVDAEHYPLRYSFVAGPAFFVSLDATVIGGLDPEQMRWLAGQLARAPSEIVILFGHLPLHPFTEGREHQHLGDPALERLLLQHEVDVFVSGHHHAYYPGRRGALRLVSTACLGGGPRPLIGTDRPSERSLLLFEIAADGSIALDAFGGEHFDRTIDRQTLPESVGTGEHRIDRDDLACDAPSS